MGPMRAQKERWLCERAFVPPCAPEVGSKPFLRERPAGSGFQVTFKSDGAVRTRKRDGGFPDNSSLSSGRDACPTRGGASARESSLLAALRAKTGGGGGS